MAFGNRRVSSKTAPFIRTDRRGIITTPGPFIGIVKNNIDPTCNGRLQVYIPQLGKTNDDDPAGWITVGYASPFRGQTKSRPNVNQFVDTHNEVNSGNDIELTEENSFQSYGMWFVPPDINVQVLCVFVNGDPTQGYWFACVQDSFDAHQVPAIGSMMAGPSSINANVSIQYLTGNANVSSNVTSISNVAPTITSATANSIPISPITNANVVQPKMPQGGYVWNPDKYSTHKDLQDYIQLVDTTNQIVEIPFLLPTSESVVTEQVGETNLVNLQSFPAVSQSRILGKQGLAFDHARGTTSASSVRESPSQVFGFSTPGRLSPFETASQSIALLSLVTQFNSNAAAMTDKDRNTVIKSLQSTYRAGGHQLVLDDGTMEGQNQGIRIRTAQGNMVLLDDTNGQIYVVNALGTAWIEMTPSGRIDIFTNKDFSVRAKGDINFHSDQNINMHAVDGIYMKSGDQTSIESDGLISARSGKDMTIFSAQNLNIGATASLNQYGKGQLNLKSNGQLVANGTKIQLNSAPNQIVSDPGHLPTILHTDTGQISGTQVWWQTGKLDSIVSRAPAHEPWSSHEINTISTFNIASGVATLSSATLPAGCNINTGTALNQPDPPGTVCSLTLIETKYLLAAIAQSESGSKGYAAVNTLGFIGKYQFGAQSLEDNGYIKKGTWASTPASTDKTSHKNSVIFNNPNNWTGMDGCTDVNTFLANTQNCQEKCMVAFENKNCATLRKAGVITSSTTHEQIGGYLYACQFGIGNAIKFAKGQPFKDAYGTDIQTEYNRGVAAIQLANNTGAASPTTGVPPSSTPTCVVAPGAGTGKLQTLVQTILKNAGPSSRSQCAHYVQIALAAAGIDMSKRPPYAAKYREFLPTIGATHITGTQSYLSNPAIGDIAVIQPWSNPVTGQKDKNNYGHICVWTGDHWVSDFHQTKFSIYKSCPQQYLQFDIFRLKWS